jgi:hypothetical protein
VFLAFMVAVAVGLTLAKHLRLVALAAVVQDLVSLVVLYRLLLVPQILVRVVAVTLTPVHL